MRLSDLDRLIGENIKLSLVNGKELKGKFVYYETKETSFSGTLELVITKDNKYFSIPVSDIDMIKL